MPARAAEPFRVHQWKRDPRNPVVSCIGEPSSGHETEDAPVDGTASRPRQVLVVGAGPAGLEAARVAALRGHRVRVGDPWSEGRLSACAMEPDGSECLLKAAANPRGMQGYAVGR